MPLPDRALQVLDLASRKGIGERPLLFVCHSLGGLLVKQILRKAEDSPNARHHQVANRTRAVLFLATPHAGAVLASALNAFRTVFGATFSIEDLRQHDSHLRDLHDWYRSHAPRLGIQTVTFYETRAVKGILPIVNPTSSHPGVGQDPVGLDEDHLSIAKPRETDAQVCCAASDLVRDYVLADVPTSPPPLPAVRDVSAQKSPTAPIALQEVVIRVESAIGSTPTSQRIPRELPPAASTFYGRTEERRRLVERLSQGLNTAIVGPAGLGKTALAAEALRDVVGAGATKLSETSFQDGIVYLDMYGFGGQAEPAWNTLANRICGAAFMERGAPRERATEACRARQLLIVIEGGEEADGSAGRVDIQELLSVVSPECRWLLLTRMSTQAATDETVHIGDALLPHDAAAMLDQLTARRPLDRQVRQTVLDLLEGHPLALNWAGNLLAREDEEPAELADAWKRSKLPALSNPKHAERTLDWLFQRSVRGLDDTGRKVLAAAGLLAHVPFPRAAIVAALGGPNTDQVNETLARGALKSLVQRGLLRRAGENQWQFTHVLGYHFSRDENGADPLLLSGLAGWLVNAITGASNQYDSINAAAVLGSLVQHAAALLRADTYQRLWVPLVAKLLYDWNARFHAIGRLDLVTGALEAVTIWFSRIDESKAKEPIWCQQHCLLSVKRGDVLRAQGDLTGALSAYQESLSVASGMPEVEPLNIRWARIWCLSQQRIGDVLRAQGDLAGALVTFRDSMLMASRLVKVDPLSAESWRALSVNQNKIGDVMRAQGDLAEALEAYRDSLSTRQRLAAADPSNAKLQRDLSVSHNKIGDVLRAQGDLAGALEAYQHSRSTRERLAAVDPSNAVWQRDLSVSQNKIGEMLLDQGDTDGALKAYRESQATRQRLVAADPTNVQWQWDLSGSEHNFGDVLLEQGDLSGALVAYQKAQSIRQRLSEADLSNAGWQRELTVSQNRIGDVLRAQGDFAGALAAYQESRSIKQRLCEADPSNAEWQRGLSLVLTLLSQLHVQLGDPTSALELAEESLLIDKRLAKLDPSNVTWQEDLEVSANLVDFLSLF